MTTFNTTTTTTAAAEDSICPICLNHMSGIETTFPILCPTQCGYNFCTKCTSHLIESSTDDYEMASDGNRHVKVKLLCPQCRADLSRTIHDTLLIRADEMAKQFKYTADSELNATELRMKHTFDKDNGDEVRLARRRIGSMYPDSSDDEGGGGRMPLTSANSTSTDSEEKDENTTLARGMNNTNNNNQNRHKNYDTSNASSSPSPPQVKIDKTLFNGLEFAMTEEEQLYVTQLMTSGSTDNLARAAEILASIADMSRKGITPSIRSTTPLVRTASSSSTSSHTSNTTRGASTRSTTTSRQLRSGYSGSIAVGRALALSRMEADQQRIIQAHMSAANSTNGLSSSSPTIANARKKESDDLRNRPLPARMPLFVLLQPFDPYVTRRPFVLFCTAGGGGGGSSGSRNSVPAPLQFEDDEWDGSIADAFARVHVTPRNCNTRNNNNKNTTNTNVGRRGVENQGVANILNQAKSSGRGRHRQQQQQQYGPKNRVLISNVRGEAGRMGLQRGDVVTHVNGEEFTGNAEYLRQLILRLKQQQEEEEGGGNKNKDGSLFSIVVNAEECTAEALRLRSLI